MPKLRYSEIADKPNTVLDMTSLTVEEFVLIVPLLDATFQARMADWRLDGKPRTRSTFTIYKNCPLPTPEDRLLYILVYLKTNPLQVAHGLLFGLPQGKANTWIHLLLPLLRQALSNAGHAPARTVEALAERLRLAPGEPPQTAVSQTVAPLFVMMEPSDGFAAPRLRTNRNAASAARSGLTR